MTDSLQDATVHLQQKQNAQKAKKEQEDKRVGKKPPSLFSESSYLEGVNAHRVVSVHGCFLSQRLSESGPLRAEDLHLIIQPAQPTA